MRVLYSRCAGLDVHLWQVTACLRVAAGRTVTTEHREFATTTAGLLALSAWLSETGCTHVAMEATGVCWKPVWHILEDEESFTLVLANAQHIRNVPGRKSDRNDAAWIADLLVVCPRKDFTLASRGRRLAETPYFQGDSGRERYRATEVELQTCSSDTPLVVCH